MIAEKEMERKSTERKEAAFDHWLSDPMTRMGMSFIPPGEHPDALKLLLRSAFDHGFGCGGADIGMTLVSAMLTERKKPLE